MTETQGDYLVTDEDDVLWLMKRLLDSQWFDEWLTSDGVRFSRSQVREALQPVGGQPYFYDMRKQTDDAPSYWLSYKAYIPIVNAFAVNALTIGLTCGEIQALWNWSKP